MVIVNFEDENYKRVTGLWQWDYGQVLRIQGLNLPKAVEIHFSLQESGGEAKKRVGFTKDGVTDVVIPESMLENEEAIDSYNIYAFIYLTDDTSGQTEYKICMPVKARPKPEAFDKPEDEEIFREAITAVRESAERAETAEKQAGEYAEQTKADAQKTTADRQEVEKLVESVSGIGEQVQAVKEYKDQAQTAATNALLSEQASEQAKEAAVQAQGRTESAADEVEQHALEVAGDKAEVERLATQVRQDKTVVEQTAQGFGNTAQQAIQSVNTAKTQGVNAINTAEAEAIKAVADKGTEQTGNVTAEGEKQVQAVQAKGQEVINSIPSDYTTQMQSKIDKQQGAENAGKSLVIGDDGNVVPGEPTQQIEVDKTLTQEGQAADAKSTGDKILQYAIKATASGESIVLTDSAEEKLQDIKLFGKSEQLSTTGKNLFDIDEFLKLPLEQFSNYGNARVLIITLKPNTAYTMHTDNTGSLTGEVDVSRSLYFTSVDDMMLDGNTTGVFKGHNITKTSDETGKLKIVLIDRKNAIPIVNKEKYVMLAEGSTATPYEPYTGGKPSPSVEYPQGIVNAGDSGEIEAKLTGKNLFDISKNKYKCDEEKICIPSKALAEINITEGIIFEEKTAYFLSWESYTITKPNSDWSPIFGVEYTDKAREEYCMHFYKNGTKTNANKTIKYVYIRNPWSVGTEINRIQIEKGTGRTEYEPFKSQTITFHLDRPLTKWDRIEKQDGVYGVVYKHRVVEDFATLVRDNEPIYGNPGEKYFSVKADGATLNYNYSKVYSEVGLYKKDVQNLYVPKVMQNSFIIGVNDTDTIETAKEHIHYKIIYETDAEEFVPLPQETQTALNNLRTYYPTTVITNSEDCEMEVTYVCDTKNYIDNKISANVASVISQYQTNVANLLSLMPLETQATMIANDTNNILENVEEMKHE